MRFLVTTRRAANDDGWYIEITQGEWSRKRLLAQVLHPVSGRCFPLPPADERHDLDPLCAGNEPEELQQCHRRIVGNRDAEPDRIRAFGKYLFTCLIGSAVWQEIITRAGGDEIELALSWPSDEPYLQQLPWEVMHTGLGYLARGTEYNVSVSRVVSDGMAVPQALQRQPRLLFVVGCLLDDPKISPGAEYLGLMRALEVKLPGGTRGLQSRIIQSVSPDLLKQTVTEFRPDIVHFICHGRSGSLNLQHEPHDSRHGVEPLACDAARLTAALQGASGQVPLPLVVVLSACESGESKPRCWETAETTALAAALVQQGIPIVVGMGGKVGDEACRLFSRAFGTALLLGRPIAPASAAGRRSAGESPGPVDWIFPQLYLSSQVDSSFAPLAPDLLDTEKQIQTAISRYKVVLRNEPPFAAHFQALEKCYFHFRRAADPVEPGVLTIVGGSGLGKTRLLQEMTIIALRDGHFPVALINTSNCNETKTFRDVAKLLEGALINAAVAHGTSFDRNYQIYQLRRWDGREEPPVGLSPAVRQGLDFGQPDEGLTTLSILAALREDMLALVQAARQTSPRRLADNAIPMLLIDDFQAYPEWFINEFFTNASQLETTGYSGIGTPDCPIPVVVATEYDGQSNSKVKRYIDHPAEWVEVVRLEPFATDRCEDLCTYGRVLLHPFRAGWTTWIRVEQPDLEDWRKLYLTTEMEPLHRIPSDFKRELFQLGVQLTKGNVFQPADDTQVLEQILQ